jgi:hypothetical protein
MGLSEKKKSAIKGAILVLSGAFLEGSLGVFKPIVSAVLDVIFAVL